jgi:hypothetical protein
MKKIHFILLIFTIKSNIIIPQEVTLPESVSDLFAEIASLSEATDTEGLATQISDLLDDPVKINNASFIELSRLFFLTEFQIRSIEDHVKKTGPVVSENELSLIPGITPETARMIKPFIVFDNTGQNRSSSKSVVNKITDIWSVREFKPDTGCFGSQWKNTTRYRLSRGNFSAGFLADKDAGEKYLLSDFPFKDFLSCWISAEQRGFISKIIIGDFAVRSSHGLALNTSSFSSFSLTAPGNLTGRHLVKPYNSTDENRFMRGVALSGSSGPIDFTLFASSKKTDATLWSPSDSVELAVSSLYTSGLHSDENSVKKKDTLGETTLGGVLTANAGNTRFTVTLKTAMFSHPFIPRKSGPDSILSFTGSRNSIVSVGYTTMAGNLLLSGEGALSGNGAFALVQALQSKPDDRFTLSAMFRFVSPGFHSLNGSIPGVSLSSFSGYSFYTGFIFEAARHLFISAGTDLTVTHPTSEYSSGQTASRDKTELKILFSPSAAFSAEATLSFRDRLYGTGGAYTGVPAHSAYSSAKIRLAFMPVQGFKISVRADCKTCSPSGSEGFMLLSDLSVSPAKWPLKLWARYSVFTTGGYESALYVWENDLPYSYSVPPLFGLGSRSAVMLTYNSGKVSLSLKYSVTSKTDRSDPELRMLLGLVF